VRTMYYIGLDVHKRTIRYCGLCGAEKSSGSTVQRTPLSKQRNKHLQTTLIEAAKMAPRNSPGCSLANFFLAFFRSRLIAASMPMNPPA
jgi:hypothetical protein